MKISQTIGLTVLPLCLSACITTGEGYRTVNLPTSFENTAERIVVTAPSRRYNDSFYNVALGQYSGANVKIGEEETENSSVSIGRVTKDDSGLSVLNLNLLDKIEYEQYPYESKWQYEFTTVSPSGEQVFSKCNVTDSGLNYVERGSVQLGIEITGKMVRTAEWVSTQLVCKVDAESAQWQYKVNFSNNRKPEFQLENFAWPATASILESALADEPATGGQLASDSALTLSGVSLSGFSIRKSDRVVSAVSLVEGNNAIWMSPDLSSEDSISLIALNYGIILYSWIN